MAASVSRYRIKGWVPVGIGIGIAFVIGIAITRNLGKTIGFSGDGLAPADVASFSDSKSGSRPPSPPNILLIIADDLGVDQVAAYGEGTQPARTPTIDALAARGVLFRNTWSNPVCSSTRATILTGRYSFRTGVGYVARTGAELRDREYTLPEVLARHPYAHYGTAAFGKWHLSSGEAWEEDRQKLAAPLRAGFSHFQGVFQNIRYSYEGWREIRVSRLANTTVRLERPKLNPKYNTSEIVNHAGQWIRDFEARRPGDPWFVWLGFNAAHAPFHKPPAGLHSVDLSDPGLTCKNAPPYAHPENILPCYHAMVEAMDRELGRLLNREMSAQSLSRTTVIFVGDNGTIEDLASDEFEAGRAKGSPYEGGVNVPLVIAGARVENAAGLGGRESRALVNTTDLFATILELAGQSVDASVPSRYPSPAKTRVPVKGAFGHDGPEVVLDSHSLLPDLEGSLQPGSAATRKFVFTELFKQGTPEDRHLTANAIRDVRGFKLIRFFKTNAWEWTEEFYDLESDPFELNDLLEPGLDKESRQAYAALKKQLDGIVASGWGPHGK